MSPPQSPPDDHHHHHSVSQLFSELNCPLRARIWGLWLGSPQFRSQRGPASNMGQELHTVFIHSCSPHRRHMFILYNSCFLYVTLGKCHCFDLLQEEHHIIISSLFLLLKVWPRNGGMRLATSECCLQCVINSNRSCTVLCGLGNPKGHLCVDLFVN